MENTDFHFLKFEDQHIKDAQKIFKKAFNYKVSEKFIANKFNASYLGISPISTIAYHQQTPVAFYGAVPQQFCSPKGNFPVAHACDSYTIPNYQKQGLHYQLALRSYELMKEQDIKLVYAFHSENTYYSTKKLGWKEHRKLARFHIKTSTLPLSKLLYKSGLKNSLYSKALKLFSPYIIDVHSNPFSKTYLAYQNYSHAFYQYKNGFNDHLLIQIDQCVFYLKINTLINVGFFDFDTEENFFEALKKLKTLTHQLGLNELLFQTDIHSEQYKVLTKIEQPLPSWLIGYLPFEKDLTLDGFGFNFADLDTF